MKKKKYKKIAKNVIDLEIKALKKLRNSINNSFINAVEAISKCQSKIILCGVGKSGLIANKIAATLSSVGSPSYALSASDCSHGDLGSISKKDVLILISYSGNSEELKNIIQYTNRNKILVIGMVSKKNSTLYKAADIKLYIPEVLESGYGIVPTSSTVTQLSLGDALAIASMEYKNFGKLDFKKFHPAGSLGKKLKTVEDLMYIGGRIPFTGESTKMKLALKIISDKKLGVLVVKNKKGLTTGLCTDGDIKRSIQKYKDINELPIKKIMTRKPIFIYKDVLAAKALQIMNEKKITSLCVNDKKTKNRTIGVLHIHRVLEADVN
jgi:arabinose-5-phosphate isomerase